MSRTPRHGNDDLADPSEAPNGLSFLFFVQYH